MGTESSEPKPKRQGAHRVGFWITLVRGIFAVLLGLGLFLQPDRTRSTFVTFMGVFWLMNGIISIRWGIAGERPRVLSLAAGIIGVLAGIGAISRRFVAPGEARAFVVITLGAVMLLTGILHVTEGFRHGKDAWRHRKHLASVLGAFEIVLGALLIAEPLERARLAYTLGSLWALLVGILLIGDALRMRVQKRRASAASGDTEAEAAS